MTEPTKQTIPTYNPIPIARAKLLSKKELVITAKLQNLEVSLKVIAKNESVHYGYTRQVWAKYKKSLLTNKGGPLPPLNIPFPFQVHNQGLFGEGSTRWYADCPEKASTTNRNAQKTHGTPHYSITFHKSGKYQIYIYTVDWDSELKKWLSEWMEEEDRHVFFDYLIDFGGKHYAAHTPGVPLGFKINIPGIGRFETDRTPFPDGTSELVMDPGFERRLDRIEGFMSKRLDLDERLNKNLESFAVGMKQHMILISTLQEVAFQMSETLKEMRK